MKSIDWSAQEIGQRFSSLGSLSEVIGSIERECSERGEVVCEVTVNGLILNEKDETKFADIRPADITALSVRVSGFGDLLDEALEALWDYIPEMIRVSLNTAEKFRTDNFEGGAKSLRAIVNGSSWLVDMLANLRNNKVVELRKLSQEQWTDAEKNLLTVAKELSSALQTKDYVLLADVLEYDWVTVLQDWLQIFAPTPAGVNDVGSRKTPSNFVD